MDTNNYIREIFTENSEWDPEVKLINDEEIKKFEKKKKGKIDMLKEKNSNTKMENIQLYIINNIIRICIFYLIFFNNY